MMDPARARALGDECADRGVAFFMKQMTGKTPIPRDLMMRKFPGTGEAGVKDGLPAL
jgi:hypothetical protein